MTADGLTRWSDAETLERLRDQRTQQAAVTLDWLQGLDQLANFPDGPPLETFHSLLPLMGFFKTSNNRVCEWMPGYYTTASLLAIWDIPMICYGANYPNLQALVSDQVTEYAHHDIFVLIGHASCQMK